MVNNSALILAVADLAYSGGDIAELLKLILRHNLQVDLQIVSLTEATTTGESSTYTSILNETLSCSKRLSMPFDPKVKDSRGVPRYGGSKASFNVRAVAVLANSCRASRKLLLPAAFGPKRAESGLS